MARMCYPEALPKDLGVEEEILHFVQNDSFAVTLVHFLLVVIMEVAEIKTAITELSARVENIRDWL
jgi:hypothetical protein